VTLIRAYSENMRTEKLYISKYCIRFEVLTAVTMKNAVFREVVSCASCRNLRLEERIAFIMTAERISETGTMLAVNIYLVRWLFPP
jgi:hypothetical protein